MFGKAKLKRFNDDVSCSPPPNAYDPKLPTRMGGGFAATKSDRFQETKEQSPGPGHYVLPALMGMNSKHLARSPNFKMDINSNSIYGQTISKKDKTPTPRKLKLSTSTGNFNLSVSTSLEPVGANLTRIAVDVTLPTTEKKGTPKTLRVAEIRSISMANIALSPWICTSRGSSRSRRKPIFVLEDEDVLDWLDTSPSNDAMETVKSDGNGKDPLTQPGPTTTLPNIKTSQSSPSLVGKPSQNESFEQIVADIRHKVESCIFEPGTQMVNFSNSHTEMGIDISDKVDLYMYEPSSPMVHVNESRTKVNSCTLEPPHPMANFDENHNEIVVDNRSNVDSCICGPSATMANFNGSHTETVGEVQTDRQITTVWSDGVHMA